MKACEKCKTSKELSEFHKNKSRKDGHMGMCKVCNSERMKSWYKENRPKVRSWTRHRLTDDQYNKMFADQGKKCAACPSTEGPFLLDHDHSCCQGRYSCGQCVRGILCINCNSTIGMAKDSKDRLVSLIAYLERSSSTG